jgi:hypothetical protein
MDIQESLGFKFRHRIPLVPEFFWLPNGDHASIELAEAVKLLAEGMRPEGRLGAAA